ncbi:phosphate signaling complex protein PhoU [Granulosicoccaceae sp. 1_MG-2023]|nr:phosphate signaling complex protein PhoU [Granulosicoccaceae sp. 1_MG-2023]
MSDLNLGDHISHRFNEELESIRSKVMTMGGLVEKQVQDGLTALIDNNRELAELVAASDVKVNGLEVEIDEECTRILAKRQPTASDLRLVVSIIKTITDLERIGDEAEKLGRYTLSLNDQGLRSRHYSQLQHLGDHVTRMLRDSLNSFAHMDAEAALHTIASDKKINAEFESISRNLITHMMEDPREIANALRVTWCARALERIGDHSKNICEYVVFFVKGKDVRHVTLNEAAESVDIDISGDAAEAIEDGDK